MTDLVLGVDAGGSNSRAVVADLAGNTLALTRGGAGNPESNGADAAYAAIESTVLAALAQAQANVTDLRYVVLAHAGDQRLIEDRLRTLFAAAGTVDLGHDVLAMYASATHQPSGGAVLAGTGSVAGRFVNRQPERFVGGTGWLVGDAGSGFAIGRQVARAVVADLDGLRPPTRLTESLMEMENIATWQRGRDSAHLVAFRLRHQLPVALARFAPLAFAAVVGPDPDPVAVTIIGEARDALADHVDALDLPTDQPLVLGGSVLVKGLLPTGQLVGDAPDRLTSCLANREVLITREGALGAAVLALEGAGVAITPEVYTRLVATADRLPVSA